LGDFLDNNFIFNILNKEHVNQTHLKLLKRYGYNFRQEDIIWYVAWYWYQCRVVNSSIEEFINKYFHEEGIQLEPSKIKIEIFSGDIAMGYIFRHQN
jgi:tagatose-1,6-bisphosphate aldolase